MTVTPVGGKSTKVAKFVRPLRPAVLLRDSQTGRGEVGQESGAYATHGGTWRKMYNRTHGSVYSIVRPLQEHVMRPLRYSINVTLDGCCDHREVIADEDLHHHAAENLAQADALLFGRLTHEMMEAAWRPPAQTGVMPDWMADWMKLRPDDRRGKEVRRVKHPGAGRLERRTRARGSGQGSPATQAGVGQGAVRGRREASAGVGGAGIDR
ncbi:hypothetical protein OKW35_003106 [Paraburkholderia sp. MM5477-R1]